MKAMIFAAGLGTRLRPLTDDSPKALVKVGGIAMLERVIVKLKSCGVDEMVVNVHYHGEKIIDFLKANSDFSVKIHVSDERAELLETGGGLLKARCWLDGEEPFIIHNSDILTDFDLRRMVDFHNAGKADATLLADSRQTSRYLSFDSQNRLDGWINVKTGEALPEGFLPTKESRQLAFGGVHILSPKIFDALEKYSPIRKFSLIPFYVDNCRRLKIMGYTPAEPYRWHDVGTPKSLAAAEEAFKGN